MNEKTDYPEVKDVWGDAIGAIEKRDTDGMYENQWTEELDEQPRQAQVIESRVDALIRRFTESIDQLDRQDEPIYIDYEFFPFEKERRELFDYSKKLAEYVHDNDIADLVIVDRSARPVWVGVKEYWRAKYPNEPMPGIYFINPKGFSTVENTSYDEQDRQYSKSLWHGEPVEHGPTRTNLEVLIELRSVYKRLLEDKDKPVVLFDSCLHRGATLAPVVELMKQAGFSDLHVVVVSPDELSPDSPVKPDYFLTDRIPAGVCYPFDREQLIEKTYNHVYSLPATDPYRIKEGARLRAEIRKIMQGYIKTI